jgi:hypothetical protein
MPPPPDLSDAELMRLEDDVGVEWNFCKFASRVMFLEGGGAGDPLAELAAAKFETMGGRVTTERDSADFVRGGGLKRPC